MSANKPLLAFLLLLSVRLFGQGDFVHLIENKGQWPAQVTARTEIGNGSIFLEKTGITYAFMDERFLSFRSQAHVGKINPESVPDKIDCHAVKVTFAGGNPSPVIRTEQRAITSYNYFLGNDPAKWVSDASAFAAYHYEDIYPGIDFKFYSVQGNLKYDLLVKKGADPSQIVLDYQGTRSLVLRNGQLVAKTSVNEWVEMKPYAYQLINGTKTRVACEYRIDDGHLVHFKLGEYNTGLPLVIDPELVFSTYTGSKADNFGFSATYDSKGFLYGGGSVLGALPFPTTAGAFDVVYNGGNCDIAISKYDTTGAFMIYSTLIGGSGSELPHSIVVDSKDQLIVYGTTGSNNFPTTVQAPQKDFRGGQAINASNGIGANFPQGIDIYLLKLSFDGKTLMASTYLGGSGNDGFNQVPGSNKFLYYNYADQTRGEVLCDELDNIYVVSTTFSKDIPLQDQAVMQTSNNGNQDGIIFKLDYNLLNILWTSYFGGSGHDAIYAIDINKDGFVMISGGTSSTDLPTNTTSIQPAYGGGQADGFVSLINPDGRKIRQLTYWGGPQYDQAYLLEFGPDNNLYVFGQTEDNTGKFTFNHSGFGQPNSGQFITKFKEDLTAPMYSLTFGNGTPKPNISPTAFLVDNCQNIYTTGWGGTLNSGLGGYTSNGAQGIAGMPVVPDINALFRQAPDNCDFHIMVLSDDASVITSGFYFGEPNNGLDHVDGGTCRFDKKGDIYHSVCASCGSGNGFPTTPGVVSNVNGSAGQCNNAVFKMRVGANAVAADFAWTTKACQQDSITFENRTSKGVSYLWDFGDGSPTSTLFSPKHLYALPGVYQVKLIATNIGSCNVVDSITRRVVIFPVGTNTRPDTLVCLSDTVRLGFTGYPGATYRWTPGRGLSDSLDVNPFIYPDTITTYTLITDGLGCKDTTIVKLTLQGVLANFERTTSVCLGDTVFFTNKSISADRFTWNFGDSTLSTETNPYHVYAHPGAYTVKLFSTTFEPGPVCSPIDSIIKVVAIYPEGRHNLPDTVFCRNDTLRLGFEHLPGATYKWTPSAGLSSDTIANPLVYVTTNRSYTLVMNAGNCRDTTSFNLIANGVSAAFTHTLSYCERDSITLSNKSVGATAYSWDFGDASGSTQFSPRHAWPDQGEYIIRLVAINDTLTTCSKTDTAYSKMIVYPRGSQTLPDTIICRSDSLQIGYAPIPGATYKWTPANGLSSDTIANPYVFTDTTRTYTLTIRALSCRDTTRITVIPRGVGARFEASTGICGNLPVVFSNKSLGANTYRWDFGDGSAGVSDTNTSHVYPGPGSYTAVLVAYSLAQEGNCPISDTFRLEVNVYPSGVHVLPDSVVCLNDTIRLGSEPIPGAVYEWIPSNGLSSDAVANPILTPDTTRNYILITRAYGCVDSAFIKLIVNGVKADFTFTANLCEDDSIRFTNKSNRGSSWIWRFGDGQTSTLRDVKHPFAEAGIYNVTLIARTTTPGSCPATDTVIKAVTIYPQGYKLRPDTTICRTDTIRIGYPTLPGATYYWTPPTGISNPSVADPFFFPDTNITYTLVSSAAGCTDTTVLNIKVEGAAASFTATPATCAQDTIFFTNTSLYTDTYRWNFGDGSAISNDTSTYHIYSQPGIYRVQLVGESSLSSPNCPATDTAVTYVVIHPTGHHYWPDTVVCKLSVIQIPFDSLPGATYTWSSSYGLSDSTIARPDITVTGDVQYDVIARAGSCIDTLSVNIITLKYDLIPFTLDTLICSGPSFTLVADGRGEIQDFTWSENLDFSTRLNSGPTDSTITVFPVTLKKYYVRGIVNNCVFIDSVRLIVAQGTTTVLPDVNLCYGDSVRIGLQVNPQPGESFKWTPADFLDDDDIPFPQTTTQDSITYRLHAVLNGCFEYFTVNVNVRSFDLVAYRDTILCDRYTLLVFTASGVNVLSNYVWSDKPDYSNVLNPNGDNMIAVRPPGNMDYYVKAMFGNCKYYDTVSIHADYITLGIDKTVPYCDKQNIVLDAQNQGGPLTYKWTPSTYIIGPDNREQVELKLPSTERMVLITTNVDGCVQRDTVLVYPDSLSFLTAEILASDTYFYKGTTIRLEGFPIGNYNYQWSPAATVNRPTSRITDAYANDSVWVYLSVSNNTCAIRDSIFLKYVEVICGPPNVFVPNAFTPNTDSQNDTLLVRGNHIELLYFTIYDRWGEKIFETSDQSIGWDGNWKGKPLDPAVFVYYLQMTCKDRQTYFEKGNITLIR